MERAAEEDETFGFKFHDVFMDVFRRARSRRRAGVRPGVRNPGNHCGQLANGERAREHARESQVSGLAPQPPAYLRRLSS